MTENEAINVMEKYTDITLSKVVIKAHNMAISALEKQIPKKPLLYKPYEGKCPVCSVIFLNKLTCYCGNCGQKLDWE